MATVYTDDGEEWTVDVLDGGSSMPSGGYWIAWGTSSAAASKTDATLSSERAEARVQATMSQPSANITQAVSTITASSTGTIVESGLFSSSAAGELIVRGDFTGIALETNDKIEFTYQITWS